jgi:acetoin utilization protein AcuB
MAEKLRLLKAQGHWNLAPVSDRILGRSEMEADAIIKDQDPLLCQGWMTTEVRTVIPSDSVGCARALLDKYRINQLPVLREGLLVGIVTDRDLRDALSRTTTSSKLAQTAPLTPDKIPVEAVMTRDVITLVPHSTVVNAAVVMRRQRIGSVPIVDGGGLVGIVTRSDILDAFVSTESGKRKKPLNND